AAVLRRVHLGNDPGIEHPLDRRVERAGGQLDLAVGPRRDVLDDGVAVKVAPVGERQEDLEGLRGERSGHGASYTGGQYTWRPGLSEGRTICRSCPCRACPSSSSTDRSWSRRRSPSAMT